MDLCLKNGRVPAIVVLVATFAAPVVFADAYFKTTARAIAGGTESGILRTDQGFPSAESSIFDTDLVTNDSSASAEARSPYTGNNLLYGGFVFRSYVNSSQLGGIASVAASSATAEWKDTVTITQSIPSTGLSSLPVNLSFHITGSIDVSPFGLNANDNSLVTFKLQDGSVGATFSEVGFQGVYNFSQTGNWQSNLDPNFTLSKRQTPAIGVSGQIDGIVKFRDVLGLVGTPPAQPGTVRDYSRNYDVLMTIDSSTAQGIARLHDLNVAFVGLTYDDGTTPELARNPLTFASGLTSPNIAPTAVPEPTSIALTGMGLAFLFFAARRRNADLASARES